MYNQNEHYGLGLEYGLNIINTTLNLHFEPKYISKEAKLMLLAIGEHESKFKYRRQIGGPARGFWQFEQAGVFAVLHNFRTKYQAKKLCVDMDVICHSGVVYNRIEYDDCLACGLARLMLWSDPNRLPDIGDVDRAYQCYIKNWNPGARRPEDWRRDYNAALKEFESE